MRKDFKLTLRIVLEKPTPGVDYGLQEGKGNEYKTIQSKSGSDGNLEFECSVKVKFRDDNTPVFLGHHAQRPANGRFIYIDIGTYAGQKDSHWSRRLKIPLTGITSDMIQQALSDPKCKIETIVPGASKNGEPNCGTVKPFNGWKMKQL
jgi:hypothetical protein